MIRSPNRPLVPAIRRKGMTSADIDGLFIHNPARMLTFANGIAEPRAQASVGTPRYASAPGR